MSIDYPYAWRNGPRWLWRSIRWNRRPMACLRLLYWTFIRGNMGETCQECERPQPLSWHAPDSIWLKVMPSKGGTLCPKCFDRKWEAQRLHPGGTFLHWVPLLGEDADKYYEAGS